MINLLQIIFFLLLLIVFYTYIGYGMLLFLLTYFSKKRSFLPEKEFQPEVTLVIAAYNEESIIDQKIKNSLAQNYPPEKLKILIVTDGSTDKTSSIVEAHPEIFHYHQPIRQGKSAAINRIMQFIDTPITVFSDANTILNRDAIKNLVRHFADEKVGGVAGEKRVNINNRDKASAAGEGFYWKYESQLKKWDSQLHTVVGAAGELFAVRTHLYEKVPSEVIIEDFFLTLGIARKGYRIIYEPDAYAMEESSESIKEELKRKVRIAAGGIQAVVKMKDLLNIFRYKMLSFQYISHRVLRWTITPLALPLLFIINVWLVLVSGNYIYQVSMALQLLFYFLALVGYLLQNRKRRFKIIFIPFYFFIMNFAVYKGFIRYLKGSQPAVWEKARRKLVKI